MLFNWLSDIVDNELIDTLWNVNTITGLALALGFRN